MLVTLDLTTRQAHRVLLQAIRTRAKLEIEPRPEAISALLWGTLAGQEQDSLLVDLHDAGQDITLAALVGAMCDVRTILSGQLCLFSSHIVDATARAVPQRLMLAVPDTIQVANRRRFTRKAPIEQVPVRIAVPATEAPFVAILSNIGPSGLACRAVNPEVDDILFIGDRVQVEFVLPWSNEVYTLPASTCSKARCREEGHLLIGFEFMSAEDDAHLAHLRAALNDEAARLTEQEGKP
jgi:hypothetical protein